MQKTTGNGLLIRFTLLFTAAAGLRAAEDPYFITYSHQMEEPGSFEIAFSTVTGRPDGGHRFLNTLTELEYGCTGWWTSELYLHGQTTGQDSTVFTGYRWENGSGCFRASTGSTQCCTWSSRTSTAPTAPSRKWSASTARPIFWNPTARRAARRSAR